MVYVYDILSLNQQKSYIIVHFIDYTFILIKISIHACIAQHTAQLCATAYICTNITYISISYAYFNVLICIMNLDCFKNYIKNVEDKFQRSGQDFYINGQVGFFVALQCPRSQKIQIMIHEQFAQLFKIIFLTLQIQFD